MTAAQPPVRRPLAQEIAGLPEGLTVRPTQAGEFEGITALVRVVDIADVAIVDEHRGDHRPPDRPGV